MLVGWTVRRDPGWSRKVRSQDQARVPEEGVLRHWQLHERAWECAQSLLFCQCAHILFLFLKNVQCGPFFKAFIESVTVLLLFYVLDFWPRGMSDLSSLTGTEPAPPALDGGVLTTALPGKSPRVSNEKESLTESDLPVMLGFEPCSLRRFLK